jgi:hypothetical protein
MAAIQAPPSARERILDTASRLFSATGFRRLGSTRSCEARVAKMTLYRIFHQGRSDWAYLERSNGQFCECSTAKSRD